MFSVTKLFERGRTHQRNDGVLIKVAPWLNGNSTREWNYRKLKNVARVEHWTPLLKPSVGKWELGTIGERIRSQVKNAVAPLLSENYTIIGWGGEGAYLGWSLSSVIMLASHWSLSHNTGLWLVMTLPRLPHTGHMLHAEHSFQMRNFNMGPWFIAEKV